MTKTTNRLGLTAPDDGDAAANAAQQGVSVRVLPQGAGRIFTGEADDYAIQAADRFRTYDRGDVFEVDAAIAAELEARGFVEIQP